MWLVPHISVNEHDCYYIQPFELDEISIIDPHFYQSNEATAEDVPDSEHVDAPQYPSPPCSLFSASMPQIQIKPYFYFPTGRNKEYPEYDDEPLPNIDIGENF